MAYYRQCARCRGTMDSNEGIRYPGEGLVCEECAGYLDRELAYRKKWHLSKEQMRELEKEQPELEIGETA